MIALLTLKTTQSCPVLPLSNLNSYSNRSRRLEEDGPDCVLEWRPGRQRDRSVPYILRERPRSFGTSLACRRLLSSKEADPPFVSSGLLLLLRCAVRASEQSKTEQRALWALELWGTGRDSLACFCSPLYHSSITCSPEHSSLLCSASFLSIEHCSLCRRSGVKVAINVSRYVSCTPSIRRRACLARHETGPATRIDSKASKQQSSIQKSESPASLP